MTRKLITLMAAAAVSLGGLAFLQAHEPGEHKHEHHGPKMHHKMWGTRSSI